MAKHRCRQTRRRRKRKHPGIETGPDESTVSLDVSDGCTTLTRTPEDEAKPKMSLHYVREGETFEAFFHGFKRNLGSSANEGDRHVFFVPGREDEAEEVDAEDEEGMRRIAKKLWDLQQ